MEPRKRIETALTCAALDRQLAGVLLIDLAPGLVLPLAGWLARLLPGAAHPTLLGAGAAEEDLWMHLRIDARRGWHYEPGPVTDAHRPAGVVAVPNLARLSSAGARAAVVTLGADVAHLERTEGRAVWQPRLRWLAACPRAAVGQLSSHLLDRFALRIDASELDPDDNASWEQAQASRATIDIVRGDVPARFSPEAADRVIELATAAAGSRRDLALGRIARALATLARSSVVRARHVDEAAALIGLVERSVSPASTEPARRPDLTAMVTAVAATARDVVADGVAQPFPADSAPYDAAFFSPYPEDAAGPPGTREPLREPWFSNGRAAGRRGHVVGVERARDVHDIAVTATLLESAKHQRARCTAENGSGRCAHGLHVVGADLRGYRRTLVPAQLLLLLLDHTSRADGDWYRALGPYLQWAYSARAAVSVVEVGAAAAPDELAATWFEARGVLDPRVSAALERAPGHATPLAHGLEIAARLLRRDTRQGTAAVREALMVLITDGRGNVPLQASHTGRMPEQAGADGVRDSLRAAVEIGRLARVRSVVIAREQLPSRHLAVTLADALGARMAGEAAL